MNVFYLYKPLWHYLRMKKLLLLLLLSPLVFSDETIVKYCMDKYDPGNLPKEFAQCVRDLREAGDYINSPKSSAQNKSIDIIGSSIPADYDERDVLNPDTFKELSSSDKEIARKIYKPYMNGKGDKAFALAINVSTFSIAGGYGFCENRNGANDAENCARKTCSKYKSRNEICAIQYINDSYVLPERITALKSFSSNNKQKQGNQFDWGRAAKAAANVFNNNPAFRTSQPTKVCNFKNFEGVIIQGDCSQTSISKGYDSMGSMDIYYKIK